MALSNLEEVDKWVLGFGDNATVMLPQELKDRVRKAAREIQGKY
jgi:predicted DNA-binding transcriptional regulator YafY